MSRIAAQQYRARTVLDACSKMGISLADVRVEQLMTPSPIAVEPQTTAWDLGRMFYTLCVRHFLVKDAQGRIVGLISDRDFARHLGVGQQPAEQRLAGITARDMMSSDVISVSPETTVLTAVRIMLENGISSLPITVDGRPVGIVTSTDLNILLEQVLATAGVNEPDHPRRPVHPVLSASPR